MENTINEMTIVPTGQVISAGQDDPYLEAEEIFENENHPHFIESNTQGITLDDLQSINRCFSITWLGIVCGLKPFL